MASCNICGGTEFEPGPSGRLYLGKPPQCASCQSLERHRVLRRLWDALPPEFLAGLSVLQFAPDPALAPGRVKKHELSIYEGPNSLDIQAIDRPDGAYDLVIANHVLEHVPDATRAVSEMLRVCGEGFIEVTVPGTRGQLQTRDWGYPDESRHGHYRRYGQDFPFVIGKPLLTAHTLVVPCMDEVTSSVDYVFLATRSSKLATLLWRNLTQSGLGAVVVGTPIAARSPRSRAASG